MFSIDGLGGFLTDKELPDCLNGWKPLLAKENSANLGLALRWEAGLAGMEGKALFFPSSSAFCRSQIDAWAFGNKCHIILTYIFISILKHLIALESIPDEQRTEACKEWASFVADMVRGEAELDPWCVERSIVSIRVAKQVADGNTWLNMNELRDLYRWMSMDVSDLVPEATDEEKSALSKPAYIGQPVDVSETHAIVRIALGVESMLSYFEDKASTLEEDKITVLKLAAIGKHFNTLKKSGL